MKRIVLVTLVIISSHLALAEEEAWALAFRAGRDAGPHGHFKVEFEDGDLHLTNLETRDEFELQLSEQEFKTLVELIRKYVHQTELEVPSKRIRDFMEVQFEYEVENKSIEVEFTFPATEMPEDIENAFKHYQQKLMQG